MEGAQINELGTHAGEVARGGNLHEQRDGVIHVLVSHNVFLARASVSSELQQVSRVIKGTGIRAEKVWATLLEFCREFFGAVSSVRHEVRHHSFDERARESSTLGGRHQLLERELRRKRTSKGQSCVKARVIECFEKINMKGRSVEGHHISCHH